MAQTWLGRVTIEVAQQVRIDWMVGVFAAGIRPAVQRLNAVSPRAVAHRPRSVRSEAWALDGEPALGKGDATGLRSMPAHRAFAPARMFLTGHLLRREHEQLLDEGSPHLTSAHRCSPGRPGPAPAVVTTLIHGRRNRRPGSAGLVWREPWGSIGATTSLLTMFHGGFLEVLRLANPILSDLPGNRRF